jgi:hypothetical protein
MAYDSLKVKCSNVGFKNSIVIWLVRYHTLHIRQPKVRYRCRPNQLNEESVLQFPFNNWECTISDRFFKRKQALQVTIVRRGPDLLPFVGWPTLQQQIKSMTCTDCTKICVTKQVKKCWRHCNEKLRGTSFFKSCNAPEKQDGMIIVIIRPREMEKSSKTIFWNSWV